MRKKIMNEKNKNAFLENERFYELRIWGYSIRI